MLVELCSGRVFSLFGGDIFRGLQMRGQKVFEWTILGLSDRNYFPSDREYLENGMSQRSHVRAPWTTCVKLQKKNGSFVSEVWCSQIW